MESATIKELIKELSAYPEDAKIFISRDTEGNSFGSINVKSPIAGFGWSEEDNAIAIYPFEEYLEDEQIMPKQYAKIMKQLKKEGRA